LDAEEKFLAAIEDEDDAEADTTSPQQKRHRRLERKNQSRIDDFLDSDKRVNTVGIMPRYYGELLTWALQCYLAENGWEIIQTLGYRNSEPVYIDVNTSPDYSENLLMNGQMLIEKEQVHFVVTVDINLKWRNSVQVEGPTGREKEVTDFVTGIMSIGEERNFYRGQKFEFGGRLRFLKLKSRLWNSIILEDAIKREIRANTVGFLNKNNLWADYGIPARRGILLAGEPGTGKTIICKALMAEAKDITCITTSAYGLSDDDYVTELYEMAEELSPCLVFIEDIDLIGQNREAFGYSRGSALLSLLAVLDGIEEKKEIVTIATTNCLETLDKALSERPSRFDRVIKLSRPSLAERKEIIRRLCEKIPLEEASQEYIARKSDGCTPAQLQEIIFGLAIGQVQETDDLQTLRFAVEDIDQHISRINRKKGHKMGFNAPGNHNGHEPDLIEVMKLN
jgi:cell division protease FtsH